MDDDAPPVAPPHETEEFGSGETHRKKKAAADFFAACPGRMAQAMELGMNQFIAFTTLARGTQGDNRTTSWGVHSMEVRDLLSRPAARAAIASLENKKLVTSPGKRHSRKLAEPVKGLKPLFLPNALVDGIDGRTPPLARLREARNLDAARLLLRLYQMCDLLGHGGIPLPMLRKAHKLRPIGRRGEFTIYELVPDGTVWAHPEFARPFLAGHRTQGQGSRDAGWDTMFWPAFNLLRDLHLIEDVIVVLDAPYAEGGHPVAVAGGGEDAEQAFATAMGNAATQLVARVMTFARDEDGRDAEELAGLVSDGPLVALRAHIRTPHAYSVFRPRYLADTSLTRGWLVALDRWREKAAELEGRAGL